MSPFTKIGLPSRSLLAHFHSPNWLWFTGFVGLNLLQSGFTQFCPLFNILGKMGVPRFPKSGCCK